MDNFRHDIDRELSLSRLTLDSNSPPSSTWPSDQPYGGHPHTLYANTNSYPRPYSEPVTYESYEYQSHSPYFRDAHIPLHASHPHYDPRGDDRLCKTQLHISFITNNMSVDVSEHNIMRIIQSCAPTAHNLILKQQKYDPRHNSRSGYGFVSFPNARDCMDCLDRLKNLTIAGVTFDCSFARKAWNGTHVTTSRPPPLQTLHPRDSYGFMAYQHFQDRQHHQPPYHPQLSTPYDNPPPHLYPQQPQPKPQPQSQQHSYPSYPPHRGYLESSAPLPRDPIPAYATQKPYPQDDYPTYAAYGYPTKVPDSDIYPGKHYSFDQRRPATPPTTFPTIPAMPVMASIPAIPALNLDNESDIAPANSQHSLPRHDSWRYGEDPGGWEQG